MKIALKLEELGILLLAIAGLYYLQATWWVYLILVLGPDISMLGYLAGNKVGAYSYNLFHHKGVGVLVLLAGWYSHNYWLQIFGIVLLGHSSMDRFFGYGLKYEQGFKFTHLGEIGKEK
ncbi:MAG: DUF4260 family protein [Sphingobacteriales bacterium]|jgi:Domain of unknown function (DUF4260)|nr:MAG: DUF4260 family protein [Sphingobacteriales bacterium]